jgi:UDP-2,4-diacetamido-2,4,6-trideoxy-beta-L-altropyranose hydrolase
MADGHAGDAVMVNKMPLIAIRTDASSQIGTGHFMRCLTLANGLKQRGAQIRFVCRHLPEHLRSMLVANGHELGLLEGVQNDAALGELAHAHWLEVSQSQDAMDSIHSLSDRTWDWLIVDHYALDSRWESLLRHSANKILAIDDIADRQHDCDVLLDQNLYADMETRYAGKAPPHCQLLLGPRYALLCDEFRRLHEQIKPRGGAVKHVLVFFGGIDADNYTGLAIETLAQMGIPGIHVAVVIGTQHPAREQIKTECARHGFVCYEQTDKMAELMSTADLAIGAGGAATWERCCLGLPALVLCTAENQQKQIKDAAQRGLLYSPEIVGDLTEVISRHVLALIENVHLRQLISDNGIHMVNGCGVSHVLASMGYNDVEIRMATLADSKELFRWRNHPGIREVSRNTDAIAWQDHQKWLASILADSKKWLLIGEDGETPTGVVRFDAKDDEAEVSIYLTAEKASSGLGLNLLHSAEHWLTANHPEICKIRAYVLGANDRSMRFFTKAGYKLESSEYIKRLH